MAPKLFFALKGNERLYCGSITSLLCNENRLAYTTRSEALVLLHRDLGLSLKEALLRIDALRLAASKKKGAAFCILGRKKGET
jgi:hypothetical protein